MSNQSGVQASIRANTGTAHNYQGDWHALFDADGIAAGTFNERLLTWINGQLSAAYANIADAMQAFAVSQGFSSWSAMDSLSLSPGGPADVLLLTTGDGLLLVDGASFLKLASSA